MYKIKHDVYIGVYTVYTHNGILIETIGGVAKESDICIDLIQGSRKKEKGEKKPLKEIKF